MRLSFFLSLLSSVSLSLFLSTFYFLAFHIFTTAQTLI